jgi:flagellar basal body-associated protein FliL
MKKKKGKIMTILLIIILAMSVLALYIPLLFPPSSNLNSIEKIEENKNYVTQNDDKLLKEKNSFTTTSPSLKDLLNATSSLKIENSSSNER